MHASTGFLLYNFPNDLPEGRYLSFAEPHRRSSICQEQISEKYGWYKRTTSSDLGCTSRLRGTSSVSACTINNFQIRICDSVCDSCDYPSMANYARYTVAFIIIVGVVCGQACSMLEDAEKSILGLNLPYGRGLDSELQLARLLMVAPRFCHPKRNSELINSLLGLPQNMNNAGK